MRSGRRSRIDIIPNSTRFWKIAARSRNICVIADLALNAKNDAFVDKLPSLPDSIHGMRLC